jgi:threonine dehydrogenase-like Zn-dependent dehydrogenase
MKTIVIFGMGSVGGSVAKSLEDSGNRVIKVAHHEKNRKKLMEKSPPYDCRFADVGKYEEVQRVANRLRQENINADSVIYTVGKYEKGGCLQRKASSVSRFSPTMIHEEVAAQLTGFLFVFKALLPNLVDNGSIIFVSAVTHGDFSHEVITYVEQERIIELMRNDPLVKQRDILIHHLGFGAILTHYYDGVWIPQALSLESATKDIVAALEFSGHVSSTKLP